MWFDAIADRYGGSERHSFGDAVTECDGIGYADCVPVSDNLTFTERHGVR
jgi:hypothetical protein